MARPVPRGVSTTTLTGPITATPYGDDAVGTQGSTTVVVDVADNVPVAAIAEPRDGTQGVPVAEGRLLLRVRRSARSPFGGRVVSYRWDFGDEADPVKVFTLEPPPGSRWCSP